MESTDDGGANFLQEDATLSSFRRRKILIAIFSATLITLALVIAALITFLVYDVDAEKLAVDPSLQSFCSAAYPIQSCLTTLYPIIQNKPIKNPFQIFYLSLQTAIDELGNLNSSLLSTPSAQSDFGECPDSLRRAINRINETFSFGEIQGSGYQRVPVLDPIAAAEEDLGSCADELDKVPKSRDVGEVEEKVQRAKMLVSFSRGFILGYDHVLEVSKSKHWELMVEEYLGLVVIYGSQFLFLCYLIWAVLLSFDFQRKTLLYGSFEL